eukprot:365205-Chlamydomonas_euryale.AAC.9
MWERLAKYRQRQQQQAGGRGRVVGISASRGAVDSCVLPAASVINHVPLVSARSVATHAALVSFPRCDMTAFNPTTHTTSLNSRNHVPQFPPPRASIPATTCINSAARPATQTHSPDERVDALQRLLVKNAKVELELAVTAIQQVSRDEIQQRCAAGVWHWWCECALQGCGTRGVNVCKKGAALVMCERIQQERGARDV